MTRSILRPPPPPDPDADQPIRLDQPKRKPVPAYIKKKPKQSALNAIARARGKGTFV